MKARKRPARSETCLVCGFQVADFLSTVAPSKSYVSIPTRPPAEDWVHLPDEHAINRYLQIVSGAVPRAEYLIGYEGNAFAATGDVAQDILSITAVHPMKKEAVNEVLDRADENWEAIERLIDEQLLIESSYEGHNYYLRRTSAQR